MLAVVLHAMSHAPGAPDDIWLILQPTQPFRQTCHIQAAIALLQESGADSVVSVVELPRTHSPELVVAITKNGYVWPWSPSAMWDGLAWADVPTRRQEVEPAFVRDGTVYAFRRSTVEKHGSIYGMNVRPLLMAPEDTCELDTEADWAEVERRWKERT
jgi:CMP-N-acetylneuraminic acid synthetase